MIIQMQIRDDYFSIFSCCDASSAMRKREMKIKRMRIKPNANI